jgi:NADH-quinone oxidoreductase subunit L
VGALICGFGWKIIGEKGGAIICHGAAVPVGAAVSWIVFLGFDGETTAAIQILRWIEAARSAPTGRSGWTG